MVVTVAEMWKEGMASRIGRPRTLLIALISFIGVLVWYNGNKIPIERLTANTGISFSAPEQQSSSPEKTGRVAIVTFTTQQKSYTHLSLKNHQHYASRQGYDLIVDYEQHNKVGTMWHKFVMIERAIATNKYDWVWWMDFDTLITNTSKPLTDIIDYAIQNATSPNTVDFIFTADCFELNAGSFITRAEPRSVAFFDRVRRYHTEVSTEEKQLNEQDCMREIIFRTNDFEGRTTFVPQWMINAFPEEIKCWDKYKRGWGTDSLAIHFAGAWAHVKNVDDPTGFLMKKYERHIIWGPSDDV